MAKNLVKTSGSVFMGNPITYQVKAEAEPVTSDITFHRVKLKVTISGSVYELSSPAQSGEVVEFDISSVFRSVSDNYEYQPVTSADGITFPLFTASLEARDIWLKEGEPIDPAPVGATLVSAECSAFMGRYSDFERLKATQTLSFTRKPKEGEIVCAGDNVVYSGSETQPQSLLLSIADDKVGESVSIPDGRKVYVAARNNNSRQFQFVNSRGVVESIRAWQHETQKLTGSSEEFAISRFETFSEFTRHISRKHASRTELVLSSGFVSYEWALWWVTEFAQSSHHWMLFDGVWVPCSVTIDDSTTIMDKTKPSMCYVQFTCKPNIDGVLL